MVLWYSPIYGGNDSTHYPHECESHEMSFFNDSQKDQVDWLSGGIPLRGSRAGPLYFIH